MKIAYFQLLIWLVINAPNASVSLFGNFAGILCYCPNRTHMLLGITIKSAERERERGSGRVYYFIGYATNMFNEIFTYNKYLSLLYREHKSLYSSKQLHRLALSRVRTSDIQFRPCRTSTVDPDDVN